jgi:PAS domain S-box-containing protein
VSPFRRLSTRAGFAAAFAAVLVPLLAAEAFAVRSSDARSAALVGTGIVLVVALAFGVSRLLTRPLARLAAEVRRKTEWERERGVPACAGNELGVLARSFNAMAEAVHRSAEDLERAVAGRTRELRDSRELYRNLVESTVDGIVTADRRGVVTLVNRGIEQILGLPREELIGREIWRYYKNGKDQAREVMRLLREKGSITSYEMELVGRDRTIPIRTSASILRDADGAERGTLGIFSDISAQRRLEAELRRAQAWLVQTMKLRALGDLVSGVAHEINNPLMASTAILHVLERTADLADGPSRRRLDVLRRCNERIARIVDHLREFSRGPELELRSMRIEQPIDSALLITGQQLMNEQVVIRRDVRPDLPPVLGDAGFLEQALLDVIANAREAMATIDGEKVLAIRAAHATLRGRPAVAVEISDTGPGIPEEIRDKIFEPFFTTKVGGQGTGLGLAVVHGIVEQHGGRIEVDGAPGKGATFRILVPAAPAPPAEPAGEDDHGQQRPGSR